MRSRYQQYLVSFFCSLVSVCLLCLCCSSVSQGADPELYIVVFKSDSIDPLDTNVVVEHQSYDIAIKHELNEPNLELGVTVTVPWANPYETSSDTPYIPSIVIPAYEEYREFVITASKSGFQTEEQVFHVIKGYLHADVEEDIEEESTITIQVWDDTDTPVEGAFVFYSSASSGESLFDTLSAFTDSDGVAALETPSVTTHTNVTVGILKDGYDDIYRTGVIMNVREDSIFQGLLDYLPIIGATFFLLFAILFVYLRKKNASARYSSDSAWRDKYFGKKKKKVYMNTSTDPSSPSYEPRFSRTNDPVIEEIRIRKTGVVVKEGSSELKKPESTRSTLSRPTANDMVHGTKDLEYKIDRITGKIDEKGKDKWFEGTDRLQLKIDEALSKQSQKKKKDDDEEET